MSIKSINLSDGEVETFANATGRKSEVFRVTVPDMLKWVIKDQALLVMKLRNSAGNELGSNSRIYVGVKEPIQNFNDGISEVSYQPYRTKDLNAQYNEDENRKMRLNIKSGGVRLEEGDSLALHLDSDEQIDIAKSTIELNDIDEKRMK